MTDERLLPVIRMISRKRTENSRLLVTIDGPCASGKTTLAAGLAAEFGCEVIHTDHFVVPFERKTPERLAIPGGNCDWERLTAEVIRPWKNGAEVRYRKFDWNEGCLKPPEYLAPGSLLILEGSYCNLPAIRAFADVRLFMNTPEETRRERLKQRESPESLERFYSRWIPLENAYFEEYGLPDGGCIVL